MSSEKTFNNLGLVLAVLAGGLMAGLLGVGGGVLLIPSLIFFGKLNQKVAHGTSLCAVVFISTAGLIAYILDGTLNYPAAPFLAIGAWGGVEFGTWLLNKISVTKLQIIFAIFTCAVAVRLLFGFDNMDATSVGFTVLLALGCILIGLTAGFVSGLFGVGGGIIMVPGLILFFEFVGADARGTSLLVILPTALIGTYRNYQSKNVELSTGIKIGIVGAISSVAGAFLSRPISEDVISIIFGCVLVVVAIRLFYKAWRPDDSPASTS